jgi:hypothetical protein
MVSREVLIVPQFRKDNISRILIQIRDLEKIHPGSGSQR